VRASSTRWLFDREGEPRWYVSAGGGVFDARNRAVGLLDGGQLLGLQGSHLGWFDGVFLRDREGAVLAFTEAARGRTTLELPACRAVRVRPRPLPLLARPLAAPRERPDDVDRWSELDPETELATGSADRG
jgi:hypothetical protein